MTPRCRCTTDSEYDICHFEHYSPMDVNQGNSQGNDLDTTCNIAGGDQQTKQCPDDTRITLTGSSNQCSLRINNPIPEDTGKWNVAVSSFQNGNPVSTSKIVEIFTFNRSVPIFQETRNDEDLDDIDVWYNWDEDEEEMREGSSGYERVEVRCNAQFGRPIPTVSWEVNRDERNEITKSDNIFKISESESSSYDPTGYIKDYTSDISFTVDQNFMAYLQETHGIDVNPSSGQFTFELGCRTQQVREVEVWGANHTVVQGSGEYSDEKISTTVTIRRVEFT